ncbi:hypothetical protein FNH22_24925 [Fulvivirga sp. M361]|uniref:hypothetical protein n=1 Tax=Fulvivirga sp. M361 TaxID=2594266 RepID=UPI00117A2FCC|nr:hypothetical protein [Fulvivirga sp. M361]TRX50899.1 hypothetical protein FNH22_24925 [Fulvivirga sp. M361]
MLDYVKIILLKVSFDKKLFEKELKKALKSLIGEEIDELRRWCFEKFNDEHPLVLQRCFVMV